MGLKPKWLHQFEVTQNQKAEWDKLQQSFGFLRGDLVMLYQDMQPEPKPAAFKAFTSASMYIGSIGFKMQLCRHTLVQCIYVYIYADQLDYKEDCTPLSSLTATNAIDVFTIIIIIIIMADVRGCVCLP